MLYAIFIPLGFLFFIIGSLILFKQKDISKESKLKIFLSQIPAILYRLIYMLIGVLS